MAARYKVRAASALRPAQAVLMRSAKVEEEKPMRTVDYNDRRTMVALVTELMICNLQFVIRKVFGRGTPSKRDTLQTTNLTFLGTQPHCCGFRAWYASGVPKLLIVVLACATLAGAQQRNQETGPPVQVNVVNVCTPPESEQKEI